MKRLLVLLLICLLPMQVLAGLLTYRTGVIPSPSASTKLEAPALQVQVQGVSDTSTASIIASSFADQMAQADLADYDDEDGYADNDDISSHAGCGDEPVLTGASAFMADMTTLAPAHRSDDAIQPPFLPPAARPPRV